MSIEAQVAGEALQMSMNTIKIVSDLTGNAFKTTTEAASKLSVEALKRIYTMFVTFFKSNKVSYQNLVKDGNRSEVFSLHKKEDIEEFQKYAKKLGIKYAMAQENEGFSFIYINDKDASVVNAFFSEKGIQSTPIFEVDETKNKALIDSFNIDMNDPSNEVIVSDVINAVSEAKTFDDVPDQNHQLQNESSTLNTESIESEEIDTEVYAFDATKSEEFTHSFTRSFKDNVLERMESYISDEKEDNQFDESNFIYLQDIVIDGGEFKDLNNAINEQKAKIQEQQEKSGKNTKETENKNQNNNTSMTERLLYAKNEKEKRDKVRVKGFDKGFKNKKIQNGGVDK